MNQYTLIEFWNGSKRFFWACLFAWIVVRIVEAVLYSEAVRSL